MMMCTRCKKRPAVVFVSPSTDMNATQGYCLVCAKELGIKPVNDIMEKMGITEEQLEAMTESMNDLMSMSDDGSFEPGGAVPFPSELLGQFGMNANGDGTEPATRESQPNDKKKKENFHKSKRKHIAAYCTDLTMKARNGELDAIIGREREIERLVSAMADLRRRFKRTGTAGMLTQEYIPPQVVLSPQDAFYGRKVRLPLEQCEGRVCGEFVMCYPPGIPILAPGERITAQILDYIEYAKAKGCNLTGPEDLHTEYLNVLTKE